MGPAEATVGEGLTEVTFTLTNSGSPAVAGPSTHPDDATEYLNSDLYRLDVSVSGEGWSARLLNALAAVEAGESRSVTVYVSPEAGSADEPTLTLRATSESDPSKTASVTVSLGRSTP